MLTPAGLGQVCQALCGDCQAAQGLFLSWKDRLTSLKQHPSQGLLIPSPAADHVNPDLSERAACPGAANPPAYRGGRDARCLSSPRLPGRACVQRSGQQASTLGGRQSAPQLLYDCLQGHTWDIQTASAGREGSGWETCVLCEPGASWGLGLVCQGTGKSLAWNKMNL